MKQFIELAYRWWDKFRPKQVMVTLNQIKRKDLSADGWRKLLKVNGGRKVDFSKEFPLSSMLDTHDLNDTLSCCKRIPEHRPLMIKFEIFCVKNTIKCTKDKRVHKCLNTIEKYLKGKVPLEELRDAIKHSHDAFSYAMSCSKESTYGIGASYEATTSMASATAFIGKYVENTTNIKHNTLYVSKHTLRAVERNSEAIRCAPNETGYEKSNPGTAHTKEVKRQTNYLRRLLNGKR